MTVSNDEIAQRVREYRKKAGKTQQDLADLLSKTSASISDLERGKVQITASELSKIAEYLNIPINAFFGNALNYEEIQNVITTIQEQPEQARISSFAMVKLFLEIQSLSKNIMANPEKEYSPEELGEMVTKLLTFQKQYKAMTSQLDKTIEDLIQLLNDYGISIPQ